MSIDLIGIKSKLVYLSGGGDDCVQLTEVEELVREVEKLRAEVLDKGICKWCDHKTSDVPEHQKKTVTVHVANGDKLLDELNRRELLDNDWEVTLIEDEDLKYFFKLKVTLERDWPEGKHEG